ncbi:WecB/TagA/CpsF family glycosyltransferase [Algibacter mikhailovii]|uniref:Beta-1,4-N-acetyl- mannosaminyltransferase n=1 Tax=Algibacter mikhailovii TaxID=425498 RepID=A0A918R9D8_9FLAO|nr:WecB/TagA/CpsF family glycosyltransferase [Algibacter mikhailovii]GGZ89240.1 beta-1,4-N-acetyl- mannosaminyltransferase [Algibacter mikhailovii]
MNLVIEYKLALKTILINDYKIYADELASIGINSTKKVINTINAHSYIVAKKDSEFEKALVSSDILLPDGEGVVFMAKFLRNQRIAKIAGADIHLHLLNLANEKGLKCFYLGSSNTTLEVIKSKQEKQYKNIIFGFFSPPFKDNFSEMDNKRMISKINDFHTDILFVGMTAPKQEKWVHQNNEFVNAKIICSIGAVFDFVAETKKRAPQWVIQIKLEWLHRAFSSWRLAKRYLYSNPLFFIEIIKLGTGKSKKM